jgi:hypothetical protein
MSVNNLVKLLYFKKICLHSSQNYLRINQYIYIMGALTLKNFPFELRSWDIEKFESIDPTDGFGSGTRVYINKQQIVQIEPDYNENTTNAWVK